MKQKMIKKKSASPHQRTSKKTLRKRVRGMKRLKKERKRERENQERIKVRKHEKKDRSWKEKNGKGEKERNRKSREDKTKRGPGEGLFSGASGHLVIGAGNWMVTCSIPSDLQRRFTSISIFQSIHSRTSFSEADFASLTIFIPMFVREKE